MTGDGRSGGSAPPPRRFGGGAPARRLRLLLVLGLLLIPFSPPRPAFAEDPGEACEATRLRLSLLATAEAKRVAGRTPVQAEREAALRAWFAERSELFPCAEGGAPQLHVDRFGRFRVFCRAHEPELDRLPVTTRFLPDPQGDLDGRPWRDGRAVTPPKRTHEAPEIFERPRAPRHERVEKFRRERLRDQIVELGDTIAATRALLLSRREEARKALHALIARRIDPPATAAGRLEWLDAADASFASLRKVLDLAREFPATREKIVVPPEDQELSALARDRIDLPLSDLLALAGSGERLFHALPDLPSLRVAALAAERTRSRAEAAENCRAIRRATLALARAHAGRYAAPPAALSDVDPRSDTPVPPCPSGGRFHIDRDGEIRCSVHE